MIAVLSYSQKDDRSTSKRASNLAIWSSFWFFQMTGHVTQLNNPMAPCILPTRKGCFRELFGLYTCKSHMFLLTLRSAIHAIKHLDRHRPGKLLWLAFPYTPLWAKLLWVHGRKKSLVCLYPESVTIISLIIAFLLSKFPYILKWGLQIFRANLNVSTKLATKMFKRGKSRFGLRTSPYSTASALNNLWHFQNYGWYSEKTKSPKPLRL